MRAAAAPTTSVTSSARSGLLSICATAAATNQQVIDNTTVQLKAGWRVGRHVQLKGTVARTSTDGAQPGIRGRGEFGYSMDRWYSTAWVDYTDSEYFPADGFLAADVIGTSGHGAYGGYTRTFDRAWMRQAGASVSFDARETTSGLRQRAMTSIYIDTETASNIQLITGITVGEYRPRRTGQNRWADRVNQDYSSFASAFYQSPTGQFGYGAQYSWGVAGSQDYGSVSPSVWLVPNRHLSFAYSLERAVDQVVQHQHVVSGAWEIKGRQSLTGRWVDYDGGYYRLSYRRTLARGIDAFGTYASNPYNSEGLMVKLVWALLR
jgi:hypothetical protein